MTASLNEAAIKGKLTDAKKHLKNGADVNARASNSATPLIDAVYHGNIKMVEFLLDNGANPNISNKHDTTPLLWSLDKGFLEITRLLCKRGANVNYKRHDGFSPLIRESYHGKYDTVKLLLEYKANPDIQNNYGLTPLHWAAEKGFIDIAQILLDNGANPDIRNNEGRTPAYIAVMLDQKRIVKLLLDSNADFTIPEKNGVTPMDKARQMKLTHLIHVMESDPKIQLQNAWHKATNDNTIKSYEKFLFHYPSKVPFSKDAKTQINRLQIENFMQAAMIGDLITIKELLNKQNIDINTIDSVGYTALHKACKEGQLQVVNLLLQKGANANAFVYNNQKEITKSIQYNRKTGILEYKLGLGATPLLFAAENGYTDIVKLLINNKADVNSAGMKGIEEATPLCIAAHKGNKDIVKILLDNDADVNVKGTLVYNEDLKNASISRGLIKPIEVAKRLGYKQILKLLLQAGAIE